MEAEAISLYNIGNISKNSQKVRENVEKPKGDSFDSFLENASDDKALSRLSQNGLSLVTKNKEDHYLNEKHSHDNIEKSPSDLIESSEVLKLNPDRKSENTKLENIIGPNTLIRKVDGSNSISKNIKDIITNIKTSEDSKFDSNIDINNSESIDLDINDSIEGLQNLSLKHKVIENNVLQLKNGEKNIDDVSNEKLSEIKNDLLEENTVDDEIGSDKLANVISINEGNANRRNVALFQENLPDSNVISLAFNQKNSYEKLKNINLENKFDNDLVGRNVDVKDEGIQDEITNQLNKLAIDSEKATLDHEKKIQNLSNKKLNNGIDQNGKNDFLVFDNKAIPTNIEKIISNNKVLDVSSIDYSDSVELIDKISKYIEQNSVGSKKSLDLVVRHDSLGQFGINVTKSKLDSDIALKIKTMTAEGHNFFTKHEGQLLTALNRTGLNISDLKVVTRGEIKSDMSFNSFNNNESFMSSSKDRSEHSQSERMKNLWEEFRERYQS